MWNGGSNYSTSGSFGVIDLSGDRRLATMAYLFRVRVPRFPVR